MNIRKEEEKDYKEIKYINDLCFNGEYESKLISNIRSGKNFILSLVVEENEKIIGHIMYSRIKIPESASKYPNLSSGNTLADILLNLVSDSHALIKLGKSANKEDDSSNMLNTRRNHARIHSN